MDFPWENITWVLLDMDGTLLDKYFDDYFWETLVPEEYAQRRGLTLPAAKTEVFARYQREEGTLNWTDIDFWSRELRIDIPALKEQIKHLIEEQGGSVANIEYWVLRILIYRVKKNRKGHYSLLAIDAPSAAVKARWIKEAIARELGIHTWEVRP